MVYDVDNVFRKILRKEIPAKVVYEDDFILAFHDINPKAKIHILLIPKIECIDLYDFHKFASVDQLVGFYSGVNNVISLMNIRDSGFRLISNSGIIGGQEVMHFHFHLLGGEKLSEF